MSNKTQQPTIADLRRSGWKVAVQHNANTTHITLTSPDGKHSEGIATPHHEDQYNRKLGNRIALGRALKNMVNGVHCSYTEIA